MAKGIKMPVEISSTGGLITIEGGDLLYQNILYAVRPASSQHPWAQKITPREDMIFDIADNMTRSTYTSHVYQVFDELQRLGIAKLPAASPLSVVNNEEGETDLDINYIDLEDSRMRTLKIRGL